MLFRAVRPGILALIGLLFFCPAPSVAGQAQDGPADDDSIEALAASVRELGLGEDGFVVGARLTAAQDEAALAGLQDDAYPGTIKFAAGGLFVVAEEETRLVLALYRRSEEAPTAEVTRMVGHLMARFGEPTTMAHGKLVYWAYGRRGKIGGDAYQEAKTTGEIDILATVKFSSTVELSPALDDSTTAGTATSYYIITSDPLLGRFVSRP